MDNRNNETGTHSFNAEDTDSNSPLKLSTGESTHDNNSRGKYKGLTGTGEDEKATLLSTEWKWKDPDQEEEKDRAGLGDDGSVPWEEDHDASTADLLESMAGDYTVSEANGDDLNSGKAIDNEMEPAVEPYLNEGFNSSPTDSSTGNSKNSIEETEDDDCRQPLITVTDYDLPKSGVGSKNTSVTSSLCDFLPAVDENCELSIKVEEVAPYNLHKTIASKLTVADEYFLHSSQNSIASGKKDNLRSNTMQNIHERASFLNLTSDGRLGRAVHRALLHLKDEKAFSSMVAINTEAMKDLEKNDQVTEQDFVVKSKKYTKNVLMISICVLLNFIALGSVRNLQSSINHEGGIGVIAMAFSFLGYMFASMFSTVLVQSIQPRTIFVAHLVPHLMYVASNIYPAPWLLTPVSFFQGMALAIGWNAMSTYLTLLAAGEAKLKDKDYSVISGKYFGIFGLFFQCYFIVGNIIASLVLTYGNSPPPSSDSDSQQNVSEKMAAQFSTNVTNGEGVVDVANTSESYIHLCGANYWQNYDLGGAALYVSDNTKFLLYGVYMACVATAILISIFQIEPINLHYFDRSIGAVPRLKKHLRALAGLWVNPKFLLIVPLQMYSFLEVGFVTAEVTKAFVTCPIGMHMVGWTMMFLGICGSITSYIGGLLTKCIGRTSQFIVAVLCNVAVLLFMACWQPTDESYLPYFAMLGLWGASDGLWVAHINSLMNTVFPTEYEEAFSGLRMCQGIGVAIVFGYSNSLVMRSKIYITGTFSLVALFLYLIHTRIFKQDLQEQKEVELMRQTSV